MKRKKKFDITKEVKAIARERVGTVPSKKVIAHKKFKVAFKKSYYYEYDNIEFMPYSYDNWDEY